MSQLEKKVEKYKSVNNCPKCGGKLIDDCCINCGFLLNGNMISREDKIEEIPNIKKINNYDTIFYNENWKIPFIIGPLYLSYKGNFLVGTIGLFLDIILFISIGLISSSIPIICFFVPLWLFIYLMINRIIYSIFANILFLKLTEVKLKRIKKKYPEEYIKKFKQRDSILFVIFSLILICGVLLIIVINRRVQNGTILDLFFW